MRLRDHYDWIVLGDDPGALLSASLAAKLGLSVLVLPLLPTEGVKVSVSESLLDLESNYVLGLGRQGLLASCLVQAGILPQELNLILEERGLPQVVTRNARVFLHSDRKRLEDEVKRELGTDGATRFDVNRALAVAGPEIDKFWKRLPERLTLRVPTSRGNAAAGSAAVASNAPEKTVSLSRLAGQMARSFVKNDGTKVWFDSERAALLEADKLGNANLKDLLEGMSASILSSRPDPGQSFFDVLHLLCLSESGAAFKGGMSAFREFLLRLARRNGADLPPKTDCRRIFIQNGKFAGVLPSIRGSMIGASGGILGVPIEKVQSLLTVSGSSWMRKLKSPKEPDGWKFSLALTLHPEAIPPGMSSRLFWQEAGAPFVEMEVVEPVEYGLKERNRAMMILRTLMPMSEESLTPAFQRLVSARMLRKATEIAPFLEFHITGIFPDFRTEDGREIPEFYGIKSLADIPAHLLCYAGEGLGAQSGVEGLFLSSRECFPELGSFGSTVAALEAVAWVAHRSGLPGPFKA